MHMFAQNQSRTACLSKEYWISPCKLVEKQECRTLVKTRSSLSVLKIEHSAFIVSIVKNISCGIDCAHYCSCSVHSRQVVSCIFCSDSAMIEQIHMDNAAICSESGDFSFSQDSRKLHKLFWCCKWMCHFIGMTGLQNICPDANKAENCHIWKHQIPDPP